MIYDFSISKIYFVTLCTKKKQCLFGNTINGKTNQNDPGKMIGKIWQKIPEHHDNIFVDKYIVMPDHLHGIIIFNNPQQWFAPTRRSGPKHLLSYIIKQYKTLTTHKYILGVKQYDWPRFNKKIWQYGYFAYEVLNNRDLEIIRKYIINNPK